jgi:hypothetical protein
LGEAVGVVDGDAAALPEPAAGLVDGDASTVFVMTGAGLPDVQAAASSSADISAARAPAVRVVTSC